MTFWGRARRRQSAGEIIAVWVGVIVLGAWFFMMLIGALHHLWWHEIPTVGYFPSLVIVFFLRWLHATLTFDNTEN